VKLPPDGEIPLSKLTQYLLVPLARADKSKFLAQAGYTLENATRLMQDIQSQILPLNATPAGISKYGDFFEIRGPLAGPNGTALSIRTIWIREHLAGNTRLVTLFPDKKGQNEF
jgi:hypothetical protein